MQAAAVNKSGVKGIAPRLEPGIPDDGAFGHGITVVAAKDEFGNRL